MPGCFQAWDAGLARALGWPLEGTHACFEEIVAQGMTKADWDMGFIWVPNAVKHNTPGNPNIVNGWKKTWIELPECSLKTEAGHTLKSFLRSVNPKLAEAFGNACRNQEQDQEQEQEQEDPLTPSTKKRNEQVVLARQVFECWQRTHGHEKAIFDRKRQVRIIARLDEGFSVADLCAAVRGAKYDDWLMGKDPKNPNVYDGLETILRDASQVEKLMKRDQQAAPSLPKVEPKKSGSKPIDAAEEALAARTRSKLDRAIASATPEQLKRAAQIAGGVKNLAGRLIR